MRICKALLVSLAWVALALPAQAAEKEAPSAACMNCHKKESPGIVKQWRESKHSDAGVECYVCHKAKEGDPSGYEHNGFQVTAVPSPRYCDSCHVTQAKEYNQSKHAWAAFMGPLKPYYGKARKMGLDPTSQETG